MKKITIKMMMAGAFLLAMTQFANAQTKKTNFLGGSAGFSSSKDEGADQESNGYGVDLRFGHYIKEKLAIGLRLGYQGSKEENTLPGSEATDKTSQFSVAPFVRLETPLWQTKFSIYSDLGIYGAFGTEKTETLATETEYKTTGFGAFYEPGILFHIKDNISLQASFGNLVGYDYTQGKADGSDVKTTSNNFGVFGDQFGLDNFRFGINLKF
jgi:hypothetical protein